MRWAKCAESFLCPSCGTEWKKLALTLGTPRPVVSNYAYRGLKASGRKVRITVNRCERPVIALELERLVEIQKSAITYWFPDEQIDLGREMMRHGLLKRGVKRLSDFYTARNLRALARIWSEVLSCRVENIRRHLIFVLTSAFGHIERTTRYKFRRGGNSSLTGVLYIGSFTVEDNLLRQLDTKHRQATTGLSGAYTICGGEKFERATIHRLGSAESFSSIPNDSIDHIFTDPPFGQNIYYSDCSILWEAWLGAFTDERREIVVNERRVNGPFKDPDTYRELMTAAFSEMHRVLKPGRWAVIEFNNSDGRIFESIKQAVRDAGFAVENMVFLDKIQKSFKQIKGDKGEEDVVGHDVIFNLRKPTGVPVAAASRRRFARKTNSES